MVFDAAITRFPTYSQRNGMSPEYRAAWAQIAYAILAQEAVRRGDSETMRRYHGYIARAGEIADSAKGRKVARRGQPAQV
ncbi:MAG TPA: hypothetical protein VEW42_03425 [Candidatus Eisenbacteria bacterium]|nr:hypothetical protein [Candidatus Eisenbacteria bacterium]